MCVSSWSLADRAVCPSAAPDGWDAAVLCGCEYAIRPLKPSHPIQAGMAAGGSTCDHGPAVIEFGIWSLAVGIRMEESGIRLPESGTGTAEGGLCDSPADGDLEPQDRPTGTTAIDRPSYCAA